MVTRCVCYNLSFADLKAIAQAKGARSVEELQRCVEFAQDCRLCVPYVERMLLTGETVFPAMNTQHED